MSGVELLSPHRPTTFPAAWYEESELGHFWFRWRLTVLRHALDDTGAPVAEPLAALDVGCGSGVLVAQLEASTAWTVDGADLNMRALEAGLPRRGRALYYDLAERHPALVGQYDGGILLDVLEHVPQPSHLVEDVLAHLRPGGLLLVNVPALPELTSTHDEAAGHL
jgi:2-polyprenyl-3-methyl-5-hydroxy-6-metoxy-1,4-benzoquinol methylase